MLQSEDWLGCGVDGHKPECLCDVVIPEGTDTSIKVADAVNLMWMGRDICDIRGYCAPWTNETIINYFTDLMRFYDIHSESRNRDIDDDEPVSLYHVNPLIERNSPYPQTRWKSVRDAVMYCMNRFDNTLAEILQHFGLTPNDFVEAVSGGKMKNASYQDINKWDNLFMKPDLTMQQLADEIGTTVDTVRGLSKYWQARRQRSSDFAQASADELAIKREFKRLCLHTDMNSTEIRDIMLREYGISYTKSAICKCRTRNGYNK